MTFLFPIRQILLHWYLSITRSYKEVLFVRYFIISMLNFVHKTRYFTYFRSVCIVITFLVVITVGQITFCFTRLLVTSKLHFPYFTGFFLLIFMISFFLMATFQNFERKCHGRMGSEEDGRQLEEFASGCGWWGLVCLNRKNLDDPRYSKSDSVTTRVVSRQHDIFLCRKLFQHSSVPLRYCCAKKADILKSLQTCKFPNRCVKLAHVVHLRCLHHVLHQRDLRPDKYDWCTLHSTYITGVPERRCTFTCKQ